MTGVQTCALPISNDRRHLVSLQCTSVVDYPLLWQTPNRAISGESILLSIGKDPNHRYAVLKCSGAYTRRSGLVSSRTHTLSSPSYTINLIWTFFSLHFLSLSFLRSIHKRKKMTKNGTRNQPQNFFRTGLAVIVCLIC